MNYNLIVIIGTTAAGKTKLAARVAQKLNTEIISADSRQVYRMLNIGTGKDYDDYVVNGAPVPYHLIDICEPTDTYHVHRYKHDFYEIYNQITLQHKIPILCGGTGMYVQAVLENSMYTSIPANEALRTEYIHYSHDALKEYFMNMPHTPYHLLADLSTAKRTLRAIEISHYLFIHKDTYLHPTQSLPVPIIFGIKNNVQKQRENITDRLEYRLNNGLVEEVQTLLAHHISHEVCQRLGMEYKYISDYITGNMTYNEMKERLTIAIHQYAKRQMTWYRKMEREGYVIHWLNGEDSVELQVEQVMKLL
ncbi:MAG: tRNA (adenosine(37)-N6)-dimethylallyltransferase MiaA [Cytophagales bacterium]|nr:tRNA (adenosine(37)-N6)-dimethylallyltransferase MiaA [Cytophagales bacterium]